MPTYARIRLDSVDIASPWTHPPQHCRSLLVCEGQFSPARFVVNDVVEREWPNPLDALRWMQTSLTHPESRWIGFLSYDCGRWFESFDRSAVDDLNVPWFRFALARAANSSEVPSSDERSGPQESREVRLNPNTVSEVHKLDARLVSTFTRTEYESVVSLAIGYIAAGDVFQVNLSQRISVATSAPARFIYRDLIAGFPSPYSALLDFGDFAIVSHSPELFLSVTPERKIITRPIKGTRPRGPGMEAELRNSGKDAAELNMIVDLERNDLGRVCELGSVRVTQPRTIETHPSLHHGVAAVEGVLRADVDLVDLLRATFPGGSITGAPKVRAMQIIDELEPVRRGPYCGAIGYVAGDGSMRFNIAIRTMTIKAGRAYVSVGGGIVADSSPAAEYEETLVKARAMFDALGISGTGK